LETAAGEEHIDEATFVAELKYHGYLKRHNDQWARTNDAGAARNSGGLRVRGIPGLSREVVERLSRSGRTRSARPRGFLA
jgi:tRNA U34 5-carboxymethylaminomethyl modifying enzyme MnmG/GidA